MFRTLTRLPLASLRVPSQDSTPTVRTSDIDQFPHFGMIHLEICSWQTLRVHGVLFGNSFPSSFLGLFRWVCCSGKTARLPKRHRFALAEDRSRTEGDHDPETRRALSNPAMHGD